MKMSFSFFSFSKKKKEKMLSLVPPFARTSANDQSPVKYVLFCGGSDYAYFCSLLQDIVSTVVPNLKKEYMDKERRGKRKKRDMP